MGFLLYLYDSRHIYLLAHVPFMESNGSSNDVGGGCLGAQ